jgi:hypothetical protein
MWADVTLKVIKKTSPNSPTYTSRSLGYIGLTMYEAVVNGSSDYKSMSGQLSGFIAPVPDQSLEYNYVMAMNAGVAEIMRKLYPHAVEKQLKLIDSAEQVVHKSELLKNADEAIASRSQLFGKQLADAIFTWSKTDGGHEGYLHHFDPDYIFPHEEGYWVPPSNAQVVSVYPLHPKWGNNRTFVSANMDLPVAEMIPYSSLAQSPCYVQFDEVYNIVKNLTTEEKNIAAWWSDDPTQSASPPGHSWNLGSIAVRTSHADIFKAAETYAKIGMAVADSFINCWKAKFTYHSGRPFAYIVANIDPGYGGFWPEPPFPAFPSGHATQSSAAAQALISIYGNDFPIHDTTHSNRSPDFPGIEYVARDYSTIMETAEECAYSRLLGGIHTRQDNEKGAEQGTVIGENVVALQWHN